MNSATKYIAGLDIGTTSVRCFIYDAKTQIHGRSSRHINLLYPQPGYVEINPTELFESVVAVIKEALEDADLSAADLTCIGISTQRSSFITWNRHTGKPYHNMITWKDLRADALVRKWNSSYFMKTINTVASGLYFVTRHPRLLAGKALRFMNTQVVTRLVWCIRNIKELEDGMNKGDALFGTLDSWLLYRLKQGTDVSKQVDHISDFSSITTTAFFDPFTMSYSKPVLKILNISEAMLPTPVPNNYDFGYIDSSLFGHEIKIATSISDQSGSMIGQCCLNRGDVKITLGTGAFFNANYGDKCSASAYGMYPVVGWGLEDKVTYFIEGASNDCGTVIEWALSTGLIDDVKTSSDIAESVPDTDGVYFMNAFTGLGAPFMDGRAACGFIGLKPSTTKAHMVRALLESIAYRAALLYYCCLEETSLRFTALRVDGGVSRNNFVCQMIADLIRLNVERAANPEMTMLGTVFLAGLNEGIYKNKEELHQLNKIDVTFKPRPEFVKKAAAGLAQFREAGKRFGNWYKEGNSS
ncbi:putative glycerol kinase 5 [Culicoides brevitarsis]|uniref:putative glycerol kinase 5 n=1 Tax=Culicoides brevitarsis TaxID=469753 RepID=UPI00307C2039